MWRSGGKNPRILGLDTVRKWYVSNSSCYSQGNGPRYHWMWRDVDRTALRDGGEEKNPCTCWDLNPKQLIRKPHIFWANQFPVLLKYCYFLCDIISTRVENTDVIAGKTFDVMIWEWTYFSRSATNICTLDILSYFNLFSHICVISMHSLLVAKFSAWNRLSLKRNYWIKRCKYPRAMYKRICSKCHRSTSECSKQRLCSAEILMDKP